MRSPQNHPPHDESASRMRAEQVELLYTHGASLLFGNTLGVITTVLLLWPVLVRSYVIAWLAIIVVLTIARVVMVAAHNRGFHDRFTSDTWGTLFVAGSAISGLGWGSLAYITADSDPMTLATVGMILAGLTGAAAPALGTYYRAYVLYASTALLPFAALCFTQTERLAFGMGVIAVSYWVCTLLFAWNSNRFTRESIRLRFQNLELLRQLQVQTQAAETARISAESANTGKTRFLAAASHDLRQPLQSITLLADTPQMENMSARARALLESMRGACTSMGELMNELMDYSRIDAGALRPDPAPFAIAPLLQRIQAEFAPLARERGLRLRLRARPLLVHSDARMVERILNNLVANAVKYTGKGGVLIACRKRKGRALLQIWDSGVGIPPDKQGEVFREFYQLDNPERDRRKGLGLGLAIVDGLARLLGQSLQLRSIPEKGSVFSLELPLATAGAPAEVRQVSARTASTSGRVLVIDNEPVIQEAMSALLAAWGCQPIAAESLEHALVQLDSAPDVILADYRLLEGRTGIEAIEGVRRHFGSEIPAAIITGDTDPHRLAEARASGFPLLQKPTSSGLLREVLNDLLRTAPVKA